MALNLTAAGQELLLRHIAGAATLTFTAIQFGNGAAAGTVTDGISGATALSNPLLNVEISKIAVEDGLAVLSFAYTNEELTAGFTATEIGVLAQDPDDETGSILYAYSHVDEGNLGYFPAAADQVFSRQQDILVYIGAAEDVTAVLAESLVYASAASLNEHVQDTGNPHQVTKEQVGLGNVENLAADDLAPTFEETDAPVLLVSGEKLSTLFGKLAAAVTGLINHLLATGENVHQETAASIGAAAETHTHSTTDLTSGTLGVARGGTGQTTAPKALYALINAATELAASGLSSEDYLGVLDASAGTGKKITIANLVEQLNSSFRLTKITSGFYTGTGTYGSNNENSLYLALEPQIVIIVGRYGSTITSSVHCLGVMLGLNAAFGIRAGYSSSSSTYASGHTYVTSFGETVTWYNDNSAINQWNSSDVTYWYVALG